MAQKEGHINCITGDYVQSVLLVGFVWYGKGPEVSVMGFLFVSIQTSWACADIVLFPQAQRLHWVISGLQEFCVLQLLPHWPVKLFRLDGKMMGCGFGSPKCRELSLAGRM